MFNKNELKHIDTAMNDYIDKMKRYVDQSSFTPVNVRGKNKLTIPAGFRESIEEAEATRNKIKEVTDRAYEIIAGAKTTPVEEVKAEINDLKKDVSATPIKDAVISSKDEVSKKSSDVSKKGLGQSKQSKNSLSRSKAEKLFPKDVVEADDTFENVQASAQQTSEELKANLQEAINSTQDTSPVPVVLNDKST